jgi:CBS domain containing-hemolysin-like protein
MLGTVIGFIVLLPFFISMIFLLTVIGVGIFFDIIGVAVTAAKESPLHAMGADRVNGSKQAIWLVRRAERVANVCNDVVGDAIGTISGAITVSLVAALAIRYNLDRSIFSILAIAATAALTVGGKAFGKVYALKNPHGVVLAAGRGLAWIGWSGARQRPKKRNGRAQKGRSRR